MDRIRGVIMVLWMSVIFLGLPVFTFIAYPLVITPWKPVRWMGIRIGDYVITLVAHMLHWGFIAVRINNRYQVYGLENIRQYRTCLVISNHCSWADTLIVHSAIGSRLPARRFLVKRELTWIPLFGQALAALGMPALQRSATKGRQDGAAVKTDQERLRRACEHFTVTGSAVTIFPEGTRFSAEKHARQNFGLKHLLRPQSGGLSRVLECLPQIEDLYDCTLAYSQPSFTLWDYLCGRIEARLHIRHLEVPASLRDGKAHRAEVRRWLNQIWQEKDAALEPITAKLRSTGN